MLGWLIKRNNEVSLKLKEKNLEVQKRELEVKQTEALLSLAKATTEIAAFINGGGLTSLLSGVARGNAVSSMLGGLTTHAGRNGLDARALGQNALEIVTQIELVFNKFEEKLAAKNRGEKLDSELHDGESEFQKWERKKEEMKNG